MSGVTVKSTIAPEFKTCCVTGLMLPCAVFTGVTVYVTGGTTADIIIVDNISEIKTAECLISICDISATRLSR
jgi:hypothetical protein